MKSLSEIYEICENEIEAAEDISVFYAVAKMVITYTTMRPLSIG